MQPVKVLPESISRGISLAGIVKENSPVAETENRSLVPTLIKTMELINVTARRPDGAGAGRDQDQDWDQDRRQWNVIKPRICFPFTTGAFSLVAASARGRAQVLRRLGMAFILAVRVVMSIFCIAWDAYGSRIASLVAGLAIALLGFYLVALALAVIGDAASSGASAPRRALGIRWVSEPRSPLEAGSRTVQVVMIG